MNQTLLAHTHTTNMNDVEQTVIFHETVTIIDGQRSVLLQGTLGNGRKTVEFGGVLEDGVTEEEYRADVEQFIEQHMPEIDAFLIAPTGTRVAVECDGPAAGPVRGGK